MDKFWIARKNFFDGLKMSTILHFSILIIAPMFDGRSRNWELFILEPWRLLTMILVWLVMGYAFGFLYKIGPEHRPKW